MNSNLKISDQGIKLIQHFEGFLSEAKKDGEHYSIGWGHNGSDVKEGQKITKAQATILFKKDIAWVDKVIEDAVAVPLLQNEFDALASLIYNIGGPEFMKSKLVLKLNEGKRAEAADQFRKYRIFRHSINAGLIRRRATERAIFIGLPWTAAIKKGDEAYAAHKQGLQAS
jgi:lysozyme